MIVFLKGGSLKDDDDRVGNKKIVGDDEMSDDKEEKSDTLSLNRLQPNRSTLVHTSIVLRCDLGST